MRRKWTDEETEFLKERSDAMTYRQMAEALGRAESTVLKHCHDLGLAHRRDRFGPKFRAFIRERWSQGWTDAQIGRAWGCHWYTVNKYRRRMGLPLNDIRPHLADVVRRDFRRRCELNGCRNLAEVRAQVWRNQIAEKGLNPELVPTRAEARIVLALSRGPMAYRQLCALLGLRHLHNHRRPGCTYTAALLRAGLIERDRRLPDNQQVYRLAPGALERVAFGPAGRKLLSA